MIYGWIKTRDNGWIEVVIPSPNDIEVEAKEIVEKPLLPAPENEHGELICPTF